MRKDEELANALEGRGPLGRSQDDEPVFVLVARDIYAAGTVRHWATSVAIGFVGSVDKARAALAVADQMDTWREAHGGGKVPD